MLAVIQVALMVSAPESEYAAKCLQHLNCAAPWLVGGRLTLDRSLPWLINAGRKTPEPSHERGTAAPWA
jgi:hypothetical protein